MFAALSDPRSVAVVRARRSARVGQGGSGRARGDRAGGVGSGRRAAQGARRRAVRPQRSRDRVDAGRPPASRAGRRDPWPGRAGEAQVQETPGQPRPVQVAATSIVAEHIGPLIDAFSGRGSGLEIAVEAGPGRIVRRPARARRADIASGPHPGPERAATIASVPFLRSRLMIVAAPGHHLAGQRGVSPSALASERWLVGPRTPTRQRRRTVLRPQRAAARATLAPTRATRPRSRPPPRARA